ncbi:MAG: hypothetical protein KDA61_22315, partial [Planctomycetales bacterium]|nr:hypothetical protein [Planctomycetales bacterium]
MTHARSTSRWLTSLFAALLAWPPVMADVLAQATDPSPDPRAAAQAGLRFVVGERLRLITDVDAAPAVDELPAVFAAAIEPWGQFFGVPPQRTAGWRVDAYLIRQRDVFAAQRLLPSDRPAFTNGFAYPRVLWVEEQASDYFRRHLMLHEGTHAFMLAHLGSCGP